MENILIHDLRRTWWLALCVRFLARKDRPTSTQGAYLDLDEDIWSW